ncbi:MAG: hypothetical protein Q8S14_16920 [Algoriphagus sp.]|uniref:hypothetical protein n=1 Tax=Algoriphagus sp. TaxID=1872435 RepID=UPI0027301A2D|nr:hypothetical protein [Algoriphagus sp.]MDP2043122.1 hypothetical protein [Algoriphagus sp.]MDP3473554.1 hypothetical protein [Algoriphagus sp.]
MKKQKIALLLSLSWLLGLIAVFSFPPDIQSDADHGSSTALLSEWSSPELIIRTSGEIPEVPGFKAEWKFFDLISSDRYIQLLSSKVKTHTPSFIKKSRPLFDVLITFFYFFYTW